MKPKPIVTIATIALNEESNIKRLLDSILKQRAKNFRLGKILVVSDGSADNTVNIAKGIKSKKS